jgi:ADP-ribosylglycohydrolase
MLPEGAYSDDTQLRLATSRAIRGDGEFDIEAFAKVELPVWSAYALGAGRGSRAAASSLTRHVRTWSTNFFEDKDARYIDGGGNGAAMRIQPHVWACRRRSDTRSYLPDVFRNSIATHGHPRGFLGAAFHAFVLAYAMEHRELPKPQWLRENLGELRMLVSVVSADASLQAFWLKKWEQDARRPFALAVGDTVRELQELVDLAAAVEVSEPARMYAQICDALHIRTDAVRGSGTHTAVAAYFLALLFQDDPVAALVTGVNELGTDTDSIATMAGGILGAIVSTDPSGAIQDIEYIDEESRRLEAVSLSAAARTFAYPDLLHWQPPESQSDAVGSIDGRTVLSGLGFVASFGERFVPKGKAQRAVWQWMTLDFGQSVLTKVREPIPKLHPSAAPVRRDSVAKRLVAQQLSLAPEMPGGSDGPNSADPDERQAAAIRGERFWDVQSTRNRSAHPERGDAERRPARPSLPDIETLVDHIEEAKFRHDLIGKYVARFAEIDHGTELGAIFISALLRRMRKTTKR